MGDREDLAQEIVGPQVGSQLRRQALLATLYFDKTRAAGARDHFGRTPIGRVLPRG